MDRLPKTRDTITAYCGLECAGCEFVKSFDCKGCTATKGRPFHVSPGQEPCAVASCALKKGVAFCGDCGEFPCGLLQSFSEDPEHGDTPKGARICRCREMKILLDGSAE